MKNLTLPSNSAPFPPLSVIGHYISLLGQPLTPQPKVVAAPWESWLGVSLPRNDKPERSLWRVMRQRAAPFLRGTPDLYRPKWHFRILPPYWMSTFLHQITPFDLDAMLHLTSIFFKKNQKWNIHLQDWQSPNLRHLTSTSLESYLSIPHSPRCSALTVCQMKGLCFSRWKGTVRGAFPIPPIKHMSLFSVTTVNLLRLRPL